MANEYLLLAKFLQKMYQNVIYVTMLVPSRSHVTLCTRCTLFKSFIILHQSCLLLGIRAGFSLSGIKWLTFEFERKCNNKGWQINLILRVNGISELFGQHVAFHVEEFLAVMSILHNTKKTQMKVCLSISAEQQKCK